MFRAVIINKDESGYRAELSTLSVDDLPPGDVLVQVQYSTLNYKDGLAITGKGPVVRKFPMVPGIDFSARVLDSQHPDFQPGDEVLLNGWGVGETHWGGLAEQARVNGDWLIKRPAGLSAAQCMAIGTAGYTSMLCVQALQRQGIKPEDGVIAVSGANGGVGSFAIRLLARLGYQVAAITGRPDEAEYLRSLGASEIIDRAEFSEPGKPLQKERWAGAIDTLGSHTLANLCASTRYGGSVAACGLAQGMDLPATVAPFILRGVNLLGIDSVMRPKADREAAWSALAELLNGADLDQIAEQIDLEQAIEYAGLLLEAKVRGRVCVKVCG